MDDQGNFIGLNHLQHMSIFGIFVVHGVIDLLHRYEMPFMPPNLDFISASIAFFWYGLAFYYHANVSVNVESTDVFEIIAVKLNYQYFPI